MAISWSKSTAPPSSVDIDASRVLDADQGGRPLGAIGEVIRGKTAVPPRASMNFLSFGMAA
ncbi:MAG TPA: hypothetical protein VMU87_02095 [Stellaceae bacterium]|nr:hypothetical protein [Stellaceae bacterium]